MADMMHLELYFFKDFLQSVRKGEVTRSQHSLAGAASGANG